jgi:hypothetical protein
MLFGGGLNTQTPPTEIADNELVVAKNIYFDQDGNIVKRPGFWKTNSPALPNSPYNIIGPDNLNGRLIFNGSPSAFTWSLGSPGTNNITGASGLSWVKYVNGTLYGGFSDGIHKFTAFNTVGAVLTNSPVSIAADYHKGRLFAAGLTLNPSRIYFSDPNAPDTWQVASSLDVGVDYYDRISAIISVGDLLFIFKNYSVWTLYVQGTSPADWVLRKINNTLGCARSSANSGSAVLSYDNEVYFISSQGLVKTNGTSFVNLSQNIWDRTQLLYSNVIIGSSTWRLALWGFNLIMMASTAYGSYFYVYNLLTKAWSNWVFGVGGIGTPTDFYVLPPNEGGSSETAFVLIDGTNIYEMLEDAVSSAGYDTFLASGYNSFADGFQYGTVGTGTAYPSQFTSKEYSSFIDWYWRNKWNSLEYTARGSPLFNMIGDGSSRASTSPGFHATLRKAYKIPGAGRCRVFQLNCVHSLTSPFSFYRGEMHFTVKTHISASGAP